MGQLQGKTAVILGAASEGNMGQTIARLFAKEGAKVMVAGRKEAPLAALAKELNLTVRYQSAYLEETWSRTGNLLMRSSHVNLTLGPRKGDEHSRFGNSLTIDWPSASRLVVGSSSSQSRAGSRCSAANAMRRRCPAERLRTGRSANAAAPTRCRAALTC